LDHLSDQTSSTPVIGRQCSWVYGSKTDVGDKVTGKALVGPSVGPSVGESSCRDHLNRSGQEKVAGAPVGPLVGPTDMEAGAGSACGSLVGAKVGELGNEALVGLDQTSAHVVDQCSWVYLVKTDGDNISENPNTTIGQTSEAGGGTLQDS
jgi:hypothetical protein